MPKHNPEANRITLSSILLREDIGRACNHVPDSFWAAASKQTWLLSEWDSSKCWSYAAFTSGASQTCLEESAQKVVQHGGLGSTELQVNKKKGFVTFRKLLGGSGEQVQG